MDINFSKYSDGLIPTIVQDKRTSVVLMLGFSNKASIEESKASGKVTFFSRSKGRLWTKGEESGHFLALDEILLDCDNDTLLMMVTPAGPVCHKGTDTCWGKRNMTSFGFLSELETIIKSRQEISENDSSYVASLFRSGINKIAQKVGEEAVEVVIEAKDDNPVAFLNESADLLFHYLMLLRAKGFSLSDIEQQLEQRHHQK